MQFRDAPFTHRFTDELKEAANYAFVRPTPVGQPALVGWASEVAAALGLAEPTPEDLQAFVGNVVPEAAKPYAARYGGHQFGHWADQLGDGRAIGFGELNGLEVQMKGAGRTPYSRGADGRAVLRSSIREFVCSEAMHHLGVPTTRALGVFTTGETVLRDMFYDGHPEREPGAITVRVAPSFVRIGNFEIFAAHEELDELKALASFVIRNYFAHLEVDDYVGLFREVVTRTARLMTQWMTKGFVHGVMNTDNMSILGLTIDYGPYGWLEEYDPMWTPNTTDLPGRRYAFGRQPQIAQWNLAQFGSALATLDDALIPELKRILDEYSRIYVELNTEAFAQKLGFTRFEDESDRELFGELDALMRGSGADFTLFYRELAGYQGDVAEFLSKTLYRAPADVERWTKWLDAYLARSRREDPIQRRRRMNAVNPRFVPRNYLLQEAIDLAAEGDVNRVTELLEVFRRPYHEQPGREAFSAMRPEWAKTRAGCSTLSCSS